MIYSKQMLDWTRPLTRTSSPAYRAASWAATDGTLAVIHSKNTCSMTRLCMQPAVPAVPTQTKLHKSVLQTL